MSSGPRTLLAVETAAGGLGVAILRDGEVVAEVEAGAGAPAAERLLAAIDRARRQAALPMGAIEAIAVSVGPGSFTGIRVGLATVKGLAFDPELPVAGVSTLAALAAEAPPGSEAVAALLDARRGELYAAVFPGGGPAGPALLDDGLFRPAELVERLPTPCILVGEGAALVTRALGSEPRPGIAVLPGAPERPRAVWVARLGARLLAEGRGQRASELQPRYVRRAEAEVQRTGSRSEPGSGVGSL